MKKLLINYLFCLSISLCFAQTYAEDVVKRTVVILYMVNASEKLELVRLSKILETPLNHLGLVVEYHNIEKGLPDLEGREEIRGILTWYDSDKNAPNPSEYVKWLSAQIDLGRKVVIMEQPGFFQELRQKYSKKESSASPKPAKDSSFFSLENSETLDDQKLDLARHINALFQKLGLKFTGERITQAVGLKVYAKDYRMVGFERNYNSILPAFDVGQVFNQTAHSYLSVIKNGKTYPVITINENGSYVSEGYSFFSYESEKESYRAWHINPFEFFFKAFGLEDTPIPDTTTLNGNRVYYSHIDGDGWNNLTQIEEYKGKEKLCAEIIYEKILQPYADLPVTVGPIGAEIDTSWAGLEKSKAVAQNIFNLPHTEVASHTYSHPFAWDFFNDPQCNEREKKYFDYYPASYTWEEKDAQASYWKRFIRKTKFLLAPEAKKETPPDLIIEGGYELPRGFAHKPFNLKQEIVGSCALATALAPKSKKAEIILWPGDTHPYLQALELVNSLGIENINGGDSRFDWENYSYAWVAPKGRKVGPYWQIYSSSSNETIYTHVWKDRFYAYDSLRQTMKNTESPLRLTPFNIYYHIYIAEKAASLEALIKNLDYARAQDLAPISTSHYAKIAQGFYKTKIVKIGEDKWRIEDRGSLQTLRFDKALLKSIDFSASQGVIGQRHYQGCLYVFLDKREKNPIIALKKIETVGQEMQENFPYLIQSNWTLNAINFERNFYEFSFEAQGFGEGKMKWKVPLKGRYSIEVKQNNNVARRSESTTTPEDILAFSLPVEALEPVTVTVKREGKDA